MHAGETIGRNDGFFQNRSDTLSTTHLIAVGQTQDFTHDLNSKIERNVFEFCLTFLLKIGKKLI